VTNGYLIAVDSTGYLSITEWKPEPRGQQPQPDPDRGCIGYDFRSGTPCERTPTAIVIAGCVHEHVAGRPLCDWHAGDAADGRMVCGNCAEAGHDVYLQVLTQPGRQHHRGH
jgi:hypothetical protein